MPSQWTNPHIYPLRRHTHLSHVTTSSPPIPPHPRHEKLLTHFRRKLCNAGCQATFDSNSVTVTHNGTPLLTGKRHPTGLWTVNTVPTKEHANYTLHALSVSRPIQFHHCALFSPTQSTLIRAIKNNHFIGFPGLTIENVRRHLPDSEATIGSHMDQQRQNIRSTRKPADTTADSDDNKPPTQEPRCHFAYIATEAIPPTGQIYTDQTGSFPVPSSRGIKYVMYSTITTAMLSSQSDSVAEPSTNYSERTKSYMVVLQPVD